MQKTKVGSVEVIALVDNIQPYPATAVYPDAGDTLQQYAGYFDAEGRVALNFGCFVCIDADTRLLVDTGFGPEYGGKLLEELAEAGIEHGSITHVLFSHLHGDHTGWNIDRGTGQPLFRTPRTLCRRETGTTTAPKLPSQNRSRETLSRCRP